MNSHVSAYWADKIKLEANEKSSLKFLNTQNYKIGEVHYLWKNAGFNLMAIKKAGVNFSVQFKKIVKRYIRVGYNLDIMRQSACLVLNPITVYSYGFLFNCTTVGQASDSMTALT